MKLVPGIAAPVFQAEDIFGQPIDLQKYAGRPTLLSFFRNGACAVCNLQVHKLIQHYPAYHVCGLEVLAVFESPIASVRQHVGKQDAPFPIIADPQGRLYELYGVESSEEKVMAAAANPSAKQQQIVQHAAEIGYPLTPEQGANFFRLPADFLIAPDLTIQRAFYSDAVGDHLPFEEIEQFLNAHRTDLATA
jgi:peroxiredoxin